MIFYMKKPTNEILVLTVITITLCVHIITQKSDAKRYENFAVQIQNSP